jgi:SAM-dependent methyltransferase
MAVEFCPGCGSGDTHAFYEVPAVPTNSVILLRSEAEARSVQRGTIRLASCRACGHVYNEAFDHALTEYSERYESTQAFSQTFTAFHDDLAEQLIERFGLRGRRIVEIGCGHGEFLALLCDRGGNSGIGYDPAHLPGRVDVPPGLDIEFVADFYSPTTADRSADFVVCKMTLEHIFDVGTFARSIRDAVKDDAVLCFQVPNGRYVLGSMAFWDVYYEHCSYFTPQSLARLFQASGFEVLDVWTGYDDQYLMIAATPSATTADASVDAAALEQTLTEVHRFADEVPRRLDGWRDRFRRTAEAGRTSVLWGGGSKAVAFLTTVGLGDEVAAAVDINPTKRDTFLAGTAHRVLTPDQLPGLAPDVVLAMNPIYLDEISADLADRHVDAELLGVS